jgi:hypothetical protein
MTGVDRLVKKSSEVWCKGTARCARLQAPLHDCLHQDDEGVQALLQEQTLELGVVPIDGEKIWPELGFWPE